MKQPRNHIFMLWLAVFLHTTYFFRVTTFVHLGPYHKMYISRGGGRSCEIENSLKTQNSSVQAWCDAWMNRPRVLRDVHVFNTELSTNLNSDNICRMIHTYLVHVTYDVYVYTAECWLQKFQCSRSGRPNAKISTDVS